MKSLTISYFQKVSATVSHRELYQENMETSILPSRSGSDKPFVPVDIPSPGEVVAAYRVDSILHVSDLTIICLGYSMESGCHRIVKLCRPFSSRAYQRSFVLRRNLHVRLDCQTITSTIAGGVWQNELPVWVRFYYPGKTLRTWQSQKAVFPPLVVTAIAVVIAGALQYAIEKIEQEQWAGYLYRCVWTLLPEHIIVTPSGDVKLLDIGLEQFFDDRLPLDKTSADLPPPQYSTKVDCTSLNYSFGMLLFELAFGVDALFAPNEFCDAGSDIILKGLDSIIKKCVGKNSLAGYTLFDEIEDELNLLLAAGGSLSAVEIIRDYFYEI